MCVRRMMSEILVSVKVDVFRSGALTVGLLLFLIMTEAAVLETIEIASYQTGGSTMEVTEEVAFMEVTQDMQMTNCNLIGYIIPHYIKMKFLVSIALT